jgi:hypothetical protein
MCQRLPDHTDYPALNFGSSIMQVNAWNLQTFDQLKRIRATHPSLQRPVHYSAINNMAVAKLGIDVGLINNGIDVINSDWLPRWSHWLFSMTLARSAPSFFILTPGCNMPESYQGWCAATTSTIWQRDQMSDILSHRSDSSVSR